MEKELAIKQIKEKLATPNLDSKLKSLLEAKLKALESNLTILK